MLVQKRARLGGSGMLTRFSAMAERPRCRVRYIVIAKSRRLEPGDNIYGHYRSIFNHCNIKAITAFKVIQGHRGWYQSKARMRLPISD